MDEDGDAQPAEIAYRPSMCVRFHSPPKSKQEQSRVKRPRKGTPGSDLPSPMRVNTAHQVPIATPNQDAATTTTPEQAQTTTVSEQAQTTTTVAGTSSLDNDGPLTPASQPAQGTTTQAPPLYTFQYDGRPFFGVDYSTVMGWLEEQAGEFTCWRATLAYCAMMLTGKFVCEDDVQRFAAKLVQDPEYLARILESGAPPSDYQELINILKEDLGITAKEKEFNVDDALQSLRDGKPVIVSVGTANDHVLLLLGYCAGPPPSVLVFDTAKEDGGWKRVPLTAFTNAANQMFLMDVYKGKA